MENSVSDLEIEIAANGTAGFEIGLRFTAARSDSEQRLLKADSVLIERTQFESVSRLSPGTDAYSEALSRILFSQSALAVAYEKAVSTSEALRSSLRVRLLLDPNEPLLHDVHWECLRDLSGKSIATDHSVLLSRYLPSMDWQPSTTAAKDPLTALIVVASPSNLNDYSLAPIGDDVQIDKIRSSLGKIENKVVRGATRLSLVSELGQGFDIIYLLCHGAIVEGKPYLLLCDDKGEADLVDGELIAGHVRDLAEAPRLMVLASCQSAQGLGSLAALLAQAGVPAILALAGNFPIKANDLFMPRFFAALMEDGFVDRAVAVARGLLRGEPSHWMPVLYTRMKSGLLFQMAAPEPPPVQQPKSRWRKRILIGAAVLVALLVALILAPESEPSVLLYSIELAAERKEPVRLATERPFLPDEHPAVHVEIPSSGYFYAFQRFDDGQYEVLFPNPEHPEAAVSAATKLRIPGRPDLYFTSPSGSITVVWSSMEIYDLKDAVNSADVEADGRRHLSHPDKIRQLDGYLTQYTATSKREVQAGEQPHARISSSDLIVAYRFRLDFVER